MKLKKKNLRFAEYILWIVRLLLDFLKFSPSPSPPLNQKKLLIWVEEIPKSQGKLWSGVVQEDEHLLHLRNMLRFKIYYTENWDPKPAGGADVKNWTDNEWVDHGDVSIKSC